MKKRFTITLILLIGFCGFVFGQYTVKGIITDEKTGETLLGAYVIIKGTTKGVMSDLDGKYEIKNITSDRVFLVCSYISYEPAEIEVIFNGAQEKKIDFKLGSVHVNLAQVEVVAKSNPESEKALMLEQKGAITVTQAIGAQELSRKGVSDAEGAVTKVAGISKQEGVKNVFVRGLGDRYNSTFFNGFPLPSEDPEYKNISLDFFSSDIIRTIYVNKVFTPDLDGDVGGANINILSKKLNKDQEFSVSANIGANNQSYSKEFINVDGVGKFGFVKSTESPATDNTQDFGFKNSLDPEKKEHLSLNQGYSISGGKKFLNNKLSIYVTGAYDLSNNYLKGVIRQTNTGGIIYLNQDFEEYEIITSHMALGTLDYNLNKNSTIAYNSLYIHSNNQSFGDYFGLNNDRFQSTEKESGLMRRQQVNDNTLFINQLLTNWNITKRWYLMAGASYNQVNGSEPDRRINLLSYENDIYLPIRSTGNQQRYFSDLKENDYNAKVDAKYKISSIDENKSELNFGFAGRIVNKSFSAIEFDQNVVMQDSFHAENLFLNNYFTLENLQNGKFIFDRNINEYTVEKYINSGYADLTYQIGEKLIAMAGVRVTQVFLNIDFDVNRGSEKGKTSIDTIFVLPSFNIKYDINSKNSLRLGLSQTYTLPQDKEISPFRYIGKNFRSQGNQALKPAINYNIDLKWDYYIASGEIFTLNGFYKYIKSPIARIEKASAGGFLTYDNISEGAWVTGIELEFKKTLLNFKGNTVSTGLNGSYIYTSVNLDTLEFTHSNSQLEGSAPFLVNADLTYILAKGEFSWTSTFVFNYFNERVYTIGTQGFENIIEKGIPTLDFITDFRLSRNWSLGIKARNILNRSFLLSREPSAGNKTPITLDEYKKGMNLSVGLTYKFD